jgi:hypothetical protein
VKRGIVFCCLALFFLLSAAAQDGTRFAVPFKQHSLETNFQINNGTGVEKTRHAASIVYYYRSERVSGITGIQINEWTTDIVLQGAWYPLIFQKLRLGLGALYHFGRFKNIYFEHDVCAGAYCLYQPFRFFYLNADVSGTIKITETPSLPCEFSLIRDNGLAISLKFGTVLAQKFRVEAVITSYELFKYTLFAHPTFSLSGAYVFTNGLYTGAELGTRYSDVFTVTSHLDNYYAAITIGITL